MKKCKQHSASDKQQTWRGCNVLYFIFLLVVCCLLPSVSYPYEIRSQAAVVMDASTGEILYAKNPHLKRHPASTTKLMTAIVAMENAYLEDMVTISKNASSVSPHKAGFKEGDRVTVEKLLYAALLDSANDAAVALAEAVSGSEARFVELMNRKAIAIGAKDTKFINSNGLPGHGQYITASNLSKIMGYALRYPKLKEIIGTRVAEVSTENGSSIFLKNTNRLLWSDEDLIGGKTGYTRKARHCFVCAAEREEETVIVTILGSPSREDLWKESEMLIAKGFRVMGNKEDVAVYFTRADYDKPVIEKTSYKTSIKSKVRSSKSRHGKKMIAKKTVKHKKTKVFVKKKGKTKTFARCKSYKKKNCSIAKKNGNDNDSG